MVFRFVFEQCVHLFCNVYKSWQIRATTSSRLNFISCTYKIIAVFAECCSRYFIKRAGKTPVLERPIHASNDKRSELRFCSKSMFSTTSCVCNIGSLKVHLFFRRRQRKRLLRKVPIDAWFIHFSVACAMQAMSATRVHGLHVNTCKTCIAKASKLPFLTRVCIIAHWEKKQVYF